MTLPYTAVVLVVIFCLMLGAGYSASTSWYYAVRLNADKIIGSLPLSDHAKFSHTQQEIYAAAVQLWLQQSLCSPKRLYYGAYNGSRVMFACKVNRDAPSNLWAVLIIGIPWGKGLDSGKVVTGFAIDGSRLDTYAIARGYIVPAVPLP